jgi:hypothetical protein
MSTYAKIQNGLVLNIIVCEDSDISNLEGTYIKQSETTGSPCIGEPYNEEANKFIGKKPYDSWVLNDNFIWESPLGEAPVGKTIWNDSAQEWVEKLS